MSAALFFMLAGFLLGFVLREALHRAERGSTPSPRLRTSPRSVSSSSGAPRTGGLSHPSNVRRVPRWEQDYAATFLDECREYGQAEATRRRGL